MSATFSCKKCGKLVKFKGGFFSPLIDSFQVRFQSCFSCFSEEEMKIVDGGVDTIARQEKTQNEI